MSLRIWFFVVLFSLVSGGAVAQTQWRLGANLGSLHIAPEREFNEFNPGLFVSATFGSGRDFEYGGQVGAYKNSYSERTIYASTYANWRVSSLGNANLRLGGFVGFFEYRNLAEDARDLGWPTLGNYVLALGPSLKLVLNNGTDFTVGFLPVRTKETSGVLTFQMSVPFGGRR